MKNGKMGVSVWENNREDIEDSATQVRWEKSITKKMHTYFCFIYFGQYVTHLCFQVVVMEMQRGDQVYVELVSGRKLCTFMEYNIFTGHIVYPYTE